MSNNKIKEDEEKDGITVSASKEDMRKSDFTTDVDKIEQSTNKTVNIDIEDEEMNEVVQPEAIIEPQDKSTIKYLSNVKDGNTGETSQPFTIRDKNYQMVRGTTPEKEIVLGVMCMDDLNEAGEKIIHSVDYFDENVATPFKEECLRNEEINFASDEVEHQDKADYEEDEEEVKKDYEDYINLVDVKGFKHFIVNGEKKTIVFKSKDVKGILNSGIKLGDGLVYMNAKDLKQARFGNQFKGDVDKLKEMEGLAKKHGVSLRKLTKSNEGEIVTKDALIESVNKEKVIKTIKIKDI